MSNKSALCALILALNGCALTKEKVGDYVTEAAVASVERKIDKELHKRDLSLAKLKEVADLDKDGKVTKAEVITTAKEMAKDYVEIKMAGWESKQEVKFTRATQAFTDRFSKEGRARREAQRREMLSELERLKEDREKEQRAFLKKVRSGQLTEEDIKKYEESFTEHRQAIKDQRESITKFESFKSDFMNWIWTLPGLFIAYLLKQWRGAGKHAQTKEEMKDSVNETKLEAVKANTRMDVFEKLLGRDINMNGVIGLAPPAPPPEPAADDG